MSLSRSRQKLRNLSERIASLTGAVLDRSPVFPGSVYESKSRCGKPQCKCATTDYRHRQWCLSYLEDGASRTRAVPPAIRLEVQAMAEEYRRLRRTEREVRKALDDLLAEWVRLREARCEAGRKRYERLVRQQQKGPKAKPAKKGGR